MADATVYPPYGHGTGTETGGTTTVHVTSLDVESAASTAPVPTATKTIRDGELTIPARRRCCGITCKVQKFGCIWHSKARWNLLCSRHLHWTGNNICWAIALSIATLTFIIMMATMIPDAYEVVGFGEMAIPYDTRSGKIENEVVGNGRYHVGLFGDVHRFSKHFIEIDYNRASGNPVIAPVKDGQRIELDITIYYQLSENTLLDLFGTFRTTYEPNIKSVAQTIIRDVAMTHTSNEFFFNRTVIEEEIRNALEAQLSTKFVTLRALYIRKIILPHTLDNNIKNIEIQKQVANLRLAELALERIYADSNRTIIQLEATRAQELAAINQNTTNMELVIENSIRRQEEKTEQLVSRLRSERDRDVTVYKKNTENLVEAVTLNHTIVLQETLQKVTIATTETEAMVAVYNEETENKRLAREGDVIAIQKDAEKQVAAIKFETEKLRQTALTRMKMEFIDLEEKVKIFIANANLEANTARSDAYLDSHAGLHPDLNVIMKMSDATVGQADFVDYKTPVTITNFTTTP